MSKKHGFTLIELLIVVAIIAILAAIAVPNFLEAQARSKVARAKADIRNVVMSINMYILDHNKIFPDFNDSTAWPWLKGLTFAKDYQGIVPDVKWRGGVDQRFYLRSTYIPLTTPVAYQSSIPLDGFSKKVSYGFDTRETPANTGRIAYCAVLSSGPDAINGDWHRGFTGNLEKRAIPYDPSNGTVSGGDVWRAIAVKDPTLMRVEYPFEFN